jgi:16S rRNA C967 or C1407 C5-methylase (RsmB/RsmF family)
MSMDDLGVALATFTTPLPVTFRLLTDVNTSNDESSCYSYADDARYEYIEYLRDLGQGSVQRRSDDNTFHQQKFLEPSPYFDPSTVHVAAVPPREWSEAAQRALSDAQDVGAVNRQELSSMVPPILLLQMDDESTFSNVSRQNSQTSTANDTKPSGSERLTVLDLCAAPGSKTLQLMDLLHSGKVPAVSHHDDGHVLIVANDSNRNRLMTLARRSRLAPGRSSLLLNSSDGRYFPSLRKWGGYKLKFDRILADVPCSGDGTLRKLSSKEWDKWNVLSHLQLHKLQVRLLVRALQSIKKGGRIVYSTCSLDPIENEAVVASAIAKLGGPDVYTIVALPKDFALGPRGTTKPMLYARGATTWVVPHPQFSHQNQTYYGRFDQVPDIVAKKHILSTMFPPERRIVDERKSTSETEPIYDNASREGADGSKGSHEASPKEERFKSSVICRDDAMAFNEILPNCCRILPQHLDSGGFFCAIIERLSSSYFAVCCPRQKGQDNGKGGGARSCKYHGQIFHPVDSPKQIQEMVAHDKSQGEEIYFEGHATLKSAIEWLYQHGAYVDGKSNAPIPVPTASACNEHDRHFTAPVARMKRSEGTNIDWQPQFTPLFQRPHPSLLTEFCNFYGLFQDENQAANAGVKRFPAEDVAIKGGGSKALSVTTCVSPDDEPTVSSDSSGGYRQQKFLSLSLMSKGIQSLYAGAAVLNPMEAGLSLTWVPIPGTGVRPSRIIPSEESNAAEKDNATLRGKRVGRYGLANEAAEVIGRCASRRVVDISRDDFVQLLESSFLEHPNGVDDTWSAGGVMVRYTFESSRKLFASCRLWKKKGRNSLELLMDPRTADSWLRLLQARR